MTGILLERNRAVRVHALEKGIVRRVPGEDPFRAEDVHDHLVGPHVVPTGQKGIVEGGYGQEQTPTPCPLDPDEAVPRILTGYPEPVRFRVLQVEPSAPDLFQHGEQAIESGKGFSAADVEISGRAGAMDRIDQEVEILGPDRLVQPRTTGVQAMGTAVGALVMKDDPDRIRSFRSKPAHSR